MTIGSIRAGFRVNISPAIRHPLARPGHSDEALRIIARRLTDCTRRTDTVARFACDEFVILLESINQSRDAEGVTEKILREIALPFLLKGESVRLTLSVSISLYPDHGEDGESLLRAADHAMYQAKRKSKNGYLVFSRHTDQTGQKE